MRIREYKSYRDYIEHQKKKTISPEVKNVTKKKFNKRVAQFKSQFSSVLKNLPVSKNARILCLGARRGEEIVALRKIGYNGHIIGVDLVAFPPNVVSGDFHKLPFKDGSFDFIFSNAVDHILDPQKFSNEVTRVSSPVAVILFHLILRKWSNEMSLGLDNVSELTKYFKSFNVIVDRHLDKQYGGGLNHMVIMKIKANDRSSFGESDK